MIPNKKAVAAVGAALMTLSLGSPLAQATDDRSNAHPESEGWTKLDDRFTIPAGSACNVAIRFRARAFFRATVNGEPRRDNQRLKPGDVQVEEFEKGRIGLINLETKRTLRLDGAGKFTDTVMPGGNWRSVGEGDNLYLGERIVGLLSASGTQHFKVLDPYGDTQIIITRTKGTTRELCTVLGARPVYGKNP
jgi:hypothetical protein